MICLLAIPWSIQSQALSPSERSALVVRLESVEAEDISSNARFLFDCLPGGRYGSSLTLKEHVQAMQLLAGDQGAHYEELFYRLARIQKLTPSDDLKKAIGATLTSIAEDQWPKGYDSLKPNGNSSKPDAATMAKGKEIYMRAGICVTCHQANGMGLPAAFPPLAGSPWLDGDSDRLIKIVLKGLMGPLKVGGKNYNSAMLPLETMLKDEEIAAVLTYVNNEWGNEGPTITSEQVKKVRDEVKAHAAMWSVDEILKLHPLKG